MKRFLFTASLIFVFILCSCSNLFTKENNNSDDKKAYVSVFFENASRTIMPDINFSELTNIVIEGDLQGDEGIHFKQTYSAYSQINNQSNPAIIIEPGTWDFSVTAYKDNVQFKGSLENKDIVKGSNTLSFVLKLSGTGQTDDTGDISLVLNYPATAGVLGVKAGLFTLENDSPVEGIALSSLRPSSSGSITSVTYNLTSVPVGNYRIKVFLYADVSCKALINTYREIVCVADQCESSAERTLTDLNELYTISYELNEGTLSANSSPEKYSKNSEFLLPDAGSVTKSGVVFAGWYEQSDYSGSRIAKIEKNTIGNKTYYAKWIAGTFVTANSVSSLNLSSLTDDVYTVALGGEWSSSDLSTLATKLANANKNIALDLFAVTNMTLPQGGFVNCAKLVSINVSPDNPDYVTQDGVLFSKDKTKLLVYPGGKSGDSYSTPAECTTIAEYAFCGNDNLTQITIGTNVTNIAYTAFNDCSNITGYVVSDDNSVFTDDSTLDIGIIWYKHQTTLLRYPTGNMATSITLPDWLTSIASYAFYGCSNLTTLTIPSSVTHIGGHAFDGCSAQSGNYVTVTFDSDGGSNVDSVSILSGQKVSKPQNPVKNGYTFNYWYKTSTGSGTQLIQEFNFTSNTITADTTLKARWTRNNYSITYNLDGGSISTSYPTQFTVDSETIVLATPTRTGYSFKGWYTSSTFVNGTQIEQIEKGTCANIVLYAKWEIIHYTIKYNISSKGSMPQTAVTSYTVEDSEITLPAPVSSAYEFVAWFNNSSFDTKVTTISARSTGDVEIWAGWKGSSSTTEWNFKTYYDSPFVNESGNIWKYESITETYVDTTWSISVASQVDVSIKYFYASFSSRTQVKFYIDGTQIGYEWGNYINAGLRELTKTLAPGTHTFKVEYSPGSVSLNDYPNANQYVSITLDPVSAPPIVF